MKDTIDTADPIAPSRRVLLFARTPAALGVALSLANAAGIFAARDAAVLGAPEASTPLSWAFGTAIVIAASIFPGAAILLKGTERGLLLSILGLAVYLTAAFLGASQAAIVMPVIPTLVAWYLSQVMGIGWRPHADQNVRDILPADQRTVFISYRRSLDDVTARMLKHELTRRGFDVFLDVDNLGPSPRFDRRLLDEIGRRRNFLLLLSPGSLDRCADENDWVRLEIAHALATGRRVIPITRGGFELAGDLRLPPEIGTLPLHNAVAYASTHHEAVIEQLIGFLCAPASAVQHN